MHVHGNNIEIFEDFYIIYIFVRDKEGFSPTNNIFRALNTKSKEFSQNYLIRRSIA